MTLKQVQRVLALIYTDKHFREAFFANNATVGIEYRLDEEEIKNISGLNIANVSFFANSLQQKRLQQIYKLLPLVHNVLGKDFINYFMKYADTHVPEGIKKYHEDAFKFTAFIKKNENELKLKYPWLCDLADYECALLRVWNTEARLLISKFRYPVNDIIRKINKGEDISTKLKSNLIIWYRFRKNGKFRQIILH